MIFKQETIQSWFSGVGNSINSEVIQPFQNAEQVIWKYNQAIQHNSLTQQGWERLLAQSDDSLKAYLTSIKGTTATMTGYNVSLQGNITGFKKVSSAITQYNSLSASGTKEQNMFANAVSVTNGKLGTYLTGLNGAKASLSGYVISLVGATVKTVALKIATIALNSAITMGASLIISGVVSAISEWIHKTENMISASEDAIEKIKSINNELKNNQKTISDTAKRYAELSQGVDQLTGKNISLSNEDYEEFLNLSNQIAEIFPELPRIYNDNGDAIVQLSGDVDTIVGSLQNLIEAQRDLANRQIVDELPTVFDGVAAKSDKYEKQLSDLESRRDTLVKSLGDVQSEEFSSNFMDGFSNKWIEISGDNLEVISQMRDDYMKILKEANIDFEELTPTYEMKDGIEVPVGFTIKINSSDEDVEKAKNTIDGKIQELASQYETDINKLNEEINTTNEKNKANWTSLNNSIFAWLSTDDSFKVMDDTMQATVQNIVNSLDWGSLNFSSWEDAKQYIQDNILSLFNTPEGKETLADIEVMFGIQTQLNNGDITVEQYQQKLQDFLNSIKNLPPETKKSILLLFGIKTNEDGTTTSDTDTMINNVKDKLSDEFDGKVGELTLDELEIASKLEIPEGTLLSWDELIAKIEEAKNAEPISFDSTSFLDSVSKIQSEYDKLLSIQKEYNESGAITASTLKDIMDNNLMQYLQFTSDGLSINTQALEDNEQALKNKAIAELYSAMCTDIQNLSLEDESKLSNIAQTALANLNATAVTAGENASIAAQGWWEYGASIQSIPGVSELTGDNYNKAKAIIGQYKKIANSINSLSVGKTSASKSASGSAKKTMEDIQKQWKEYLDKYLAMYKAELDAGLIDFNTFLNKSRSLLDEYYRDGKISAKDYWDSVKSLYENQLSIYDKVLSAVTRRIEKEVDGIQDIIDGLEEQNDALQKQLDEYDSILSVVDEVYQDEIDRLQDEKDLLSEKISQLQDEADAYDLLRRKEEAIYSLRRAQEQRTKKVFNGKEFIFTTDQNAVRDAQQTLQDIKTEELINNLEKEQEGIDAEIEKLQEYKEKWQEITSAKETEQNKQLAIALWGQDYERFILQNRLSDIESFKNNYVSIQKQIENNQGLIDSYNQKVDYYNKLKEQWSSISDAYKQAQEDQYAAMVLGAQWESDVLSGRINVLNNFKNQYIAIQQAITNAALEAARAQALAAQSVSTSSSSGNTSTGSSNVSQISKPQQTKSFHVVQKVGSGYSTQSRAEQKIDRYNGDGVLWDGSNNKWYVYKNKKYSSTPFKTYSDAINSDIYKKAGRLKAVAYYASGTSNAKKGLNIVGEAGTETYIDNDGNVSLVTKPSLIEMEGGETVKNAKETQDLLNPDNLVPVEMMEFPGINGKTLKLSTDEFMDKVASVMPNYSSMVQSAIQMPKYDFTPVSRDNSTSVSIGEIHLHEVNNVDSFANAIIRELPSKANQISNRR